MNLFRSLTAVKGTVIPVLIIIALLFCTSCRWEKETKGGVEFAVLKDSNQKHYNCAKYTYAKLTATSPDSCTKIEHDMSVAALKTKLNKKNSGYTRYKEESDCKCEKGGKNNKNCAVLYYNEEDGEGFHWAALDTKLCNWGGKLSSTGKIARSEKAEDYIKRLDSELQKTTKMEFYCKDKNSSYISDEDLHDNAKPCTN